MTRWRRRDLGTTDRVQVYRLRVGHLTCSVEYFDGKGTGWHAAVYALDLPYRGLLWQSPGYVYAKRETAQRATVRHARRLLERALDALELAP